MAGETGHIQIVEFSKEVIPQINWMLEDLFCQYGVAMPYFLLEYDFPDYSERPEWATGYYYNLDWGPWGYYLPWFNELLGLLFDTAGLPRWQMPDFSLGSWDMFNSQISQLYQNTGGQTFTATIKFLERMGQGTSHSEAWSDYDSAPDYTLNELAFGLTMFGASYVGVDDYEALGYKSYLNFDTSTATAGKSTLILRLVVDYVYTAKGTPVVYVYDHDFGDTVNSGDWTGGSLIAEEEINSTGTYNIALPIETINIGSSTKLRLSEKICEENDPPEGIGGPTARFTAQLRWGKV